MGIDRSTLSTRQHRRGHERGDRQPTPLVPILGGHSLEITKRRAVGALPKMFSLYQTCHRWLQYWRKTGTFEKILFALANMALEQGKLGLDEEVYRTQTFAPPERGSLVGRPKGQRTKIMAIVGGTWLSDSIAY